MNFRFLRSKKFMVGQSCENLFIVSLDPHSRLSRRVAVFGLGGTSEQTREESRAAGR